MIFDVKKALQIILFFARKNSQQGEIEYTKVLKLLFLADKLFLKRYGTTISWDHYVAMRFWPVASSIFNVMKEPERFWDLEESINATIRINLETRTLKALKKTDIEYLSKLELDTLSEIFEIFGKYSYSKLIDICHGYDEWAKHKDNIGSSCIPMEFLDFFAPSQWENNIFKMDADEIELSKAIYQEQVQYA